MDHDRMDPRDRGVSGAEGPPPPPRTTNHRAPDGSRDRSRGKFQRFAPSASIRVGAFQTIPTQQTLGTVG